MKKARLVALLLALTLVSHEVLAELRVEDTGGKPAARKIIITSQGVYRAEVWHAAGGGIMRFYNLATDPEAKVNLASTRAGRGLFEIGWHGAAFKGPDKKDCCAKHILSKQPKKEGEKCYDGCGDWPSMGHEALARKHKDPTIMGKLDIIEKSPARVRVRAKAPFVWWGKYVHKLEATGTYTFYPTGRIVIQVHVQNPGKRPFHWSGEYGPHLMVPGDNKRPEHDRGFKWSTPKMDTLKGGPSEELVLAASEKVKTAFLLAVPTEANKVFNRWMHHNGRGIGWDRCGYGSNNLVMEPGYDSTWTCMIQMGTPGNKLAPEVKDAKAAMPLALQYREPAKITGVALITDDEGDLNEDAYNESEGCHVLKGPGPLRFTYEKGKGAGFAPVFKVVGWKGAAPRTVTVDGKLVEFVAGVVDGNLLVQILDGIDATKASIELGKQGT